MDERDLRLDRINDNITLTQSRRGLSFTTDAYLLSAFVKKPRGSFERALELGAGTGVISLLLAARGRAKKITAVEVQASLYDIMCKNIGDNGFADVVAPVCADVREITESSLGGQFDAVFSNPPYMRAGSGFESAADEANISRREIFGGLGDFCAAASRLCKNGGMFYIVFRPERLTDLLHELRVCGFEPKLLTLLCPDADSAPSLVFAAARRGGRPGGLRITKPLFVYERGTRDETDDFRYIYETGQFHEAFTVS